MRVIEAVTVYFCSREPRCPLRADSLYIGPHGPAKVKQSALGPGGARGTRGSPHPRVNTLQRNEQDCLLGGQSCTSEIKFLFKTKQNRTKQVLFFSPSLWASNDMGPGDCVVFQRGREAASETQR